ncbi:MAG: phage tail sheath family protein [Steroidobacteraceae bacterium]|nr:phage tail sheath family protein [Steroidobacteraceae bacterium]
MAERRVSGIEIADPRGSTRAIARAPTAIAAFVGRTLKGPLNRPVSVASFAEYTQVFGGLWQPSTVSYAVEQFFENGGREAYIVRVANGARPPTITLPAGSHRLTLSGLNPGSREFLRASVDYDGIADSEADRFNLVVQRVRAAGSELIEEQEIFRRLSVREDSGRFVADVLCDSHLVRVVGEVPPQRPDRSVRHPESPVVGYVSSNADGDDGGPITDYDVIGSAAEGTGLFALQSVSFNLLCIPPLTREQDVGLSTLMIAARFCRNQHAMLVVDPPSAWQSASEALEQLRRWPFRSENALMYFPRVVALDRLRGRHETFGSCGAAAGLIARSDETWPVWAAAEGEEGILRPGLRPACMVSEPERMRLAQAGVNTLLSVRSSQRATASPRTLAAGSSGSADWKYLSARRLALFVTASIERGTRWLLFEPNAEPAWARAREQVTTFLDELDQQGAFAGSMPEESYFVICDERVNPPETVAEGKVKLLFGIAITRPGDFHAWLITHHASGSTCRPTWPNRLTTSGRRLEWEIETAILRGVRVE